jgi:hypothetical protein
MTLTPVGRDYASRTEVLADFLADATFLAHPEEQLTNRMQLEAAKTREVCIRYKGLTRITTLRKTATSWEME